MSVVQKLTVLLDPIREALSHATLYHYAALALVFLLFTVLFILSILLHRHTVTSILLGLVSLAVLTGGPFGAYRFVESTVRKVEFSNLRSKQLVFIDDIVVTGTLTNKGKIDYQECTLTVSLSRPPRFGFLTAITPYLPIKEETTVLKKTIARGDSADFRAVTTGLGHTPAVVSITGSCR